MLLGGRCLHRGVLFTQGDVVYTGGGGALFTQGDVVYTGGTLFT